MGIAAAFATGLVQGFSENIDKEQARRDKQRDRVNAYQDYAVKAMIEGKASEAGLNAVKDLVKKANTQIDSMEPIGPFGKRGRDIALDMASVQGALGDATDYNFKIPGSTKNSFLGFSIADGKGSPNDSFAFLNEYSNMITRPEIQEKLRKDPVLAQNVQNMLSGMQMRIVSNDMGKILSSGKGDLSGYMTPELFGISPTSPYQALALHNKIMKDLGIPVPSVTDTVDSAKSELGQSGGSGDGSDTGDLTIATVIEPQKGGEDGQQTIGYKVGSLQVRPEDMPIYMGLAKKLGVPVKSVVGGALPLYNYWVGIDGNGIPLSGDRQYFDFLGMEPSQKRDALSASIQLSSYPGVSSLDPEIGLYKLGYNEEGDTEILKFNNVLNSTKATTFTQFVMAIAPYMTFNKEKNEVKVFGFQTQDKGLTRANYVLRKRYGKLAGTTEKLTMGFLSKELANKKTAMIALKALQQKRADFDDPEVYASFKKAMGVAFGGKGSIREAIANDLLGLGVVEEQTTDLSDDFISSLDKGIEDKRSRGGDALAELEAMRISLAFQLARAADPSGRLSNQDVQQQLDRLGAGFNTKKQALLKIQVVIDELDRDIQKLKVFETYGKGNAVLTANEAKIIDAAFAVDYVRNRANALNQAPKTGGDGSKPLIADEYIINNDGSVMDKDFNTVDDPALIEAIKKAKAPKVGT